MRGQPFSAKDKRALKWAKRLVMVSMFGYACLMIGALSACTTGVVKDTVTRPPAMGPHHAGPNTWNREDSEKRQAFCYAEVLKVVKAAKGVVDADLPAVKAMWFDCMNQNGGVI